MYDWLPAMAADPHLTRVLRTLQNASLESHLQLFELAAENGGQLTVEQMPSHLGARGSDDHEGWAMRGQNQGGGHGDQRHSHSPTEEPHSRGL